VSGYLRTARTDDGALGSRAVDQMSGSAASHAWLSVLSPGTGWGEIDPANRTFVDEGFVTAAWGRDYPDGPPLKRIAVGPPGAGRSLDVAVGAVPLTDADN